MDDQILSLVMECRKGIKEFREYLERCIAAQEKPIRAARILRYLDMVESGEIVGPKSYSHYENVLEKALVNNMRAALKECFYKNENYSEKAKSLLLKMYRDNEWEFFGRYVFTSKEGAKT
jgi:hypothetical protein